MEAVHRMQQERAGGLGGDGARWLHPEPDGCKAMLKPCCQRGHGGKEQTLRYLWYPKKPHVR